MLSGDKNGGRVANEVKTLEQRLGERFEREVSGEMERKDMCKALFWPVLGFGALWAAWNVFEYILISYQGSESHDVEAYKGEKKLSSVPINIR